MKVLFLVSLNLILALLFAILFRKRKLLSYHDAGRWWLTWLACFFSAIILITRGSQTILADMCALGLLASFCINMLSLIIYRYAMGTTEIIRYHTSRFGTLILFTILMGCFLFLAADKPYGLALWSTVTTVVLVAGFFLAKKRSPEVMEIGEAETEADAILYLANSKEPEVTVFFMRPREAALGSP